MPKHRSKIEKLIAGIVARQNKLRTAIDEIVADLEGGAQCRMRRIQLLSSS